MNIRAARMQPAGSDGGGYPSGGALWVPTQICREEKSLLTRPTAVGSLSIISCKFGYVFEYSIKF